MFVLFFVLVCCANLLHDATTNVDQYFHSSTRGLSGIYFSTLEPRKPTSSCPKGGGHSLGMKVFLAAVSGVAYVSMAQVGGQVPDLRFPLPQCQGFSWDGVCVFFTCCHKIGYFRLSVELFACIEIKVLPTSSLEDDV